MRVWIDLSNSPHALLFAPVARRLEEMGHSVFVTARDNAQTVELGRTYWPDLEVVGSESPAGRLAKARTLAGRVEALRQIARRRRPDVALSHNSYAQIVAAKLCGVRTVTAMDYEFQPANHLAFRLADRVLLPEALRGTGVRKQGARDGKTRYYAGLKEEIYLGDFAPDETVAARIGFNPTDGRPLVVIRTPPSRAVYHQFGNPLFEDVLRSVGSNPHALCVVLPRHWEQREAIDALRLPSVVVPTSAVDSRSLMYTADVVIGAGGTMTREAALLGVPTFSVFAGAPSAVDTFLVERGQLRRLESVRDLPLPERRVPQERDLGELRLRADTLVGWMIEAAGLADG